MNDKNQLFDVFIIGTGPAGLTAAIYCKRACLNVALIEKDYPGGKLTKTLSIENYPGYLDTSGIKLAENMMEQVKHNQIPVFDGEIIDIKKNNQYWEIIDKNQIFKSKAVLIATGSKERKLNIENEEEYYGNGVSYCAICDGNLYKGQDVVVVGGGNSAVEEAIYLSKLVKTVNLIHRRHEFRAEEISVHQMKQIKNINILTPYVAKKILVKDNKVYGLEVDNLEENKTQIINCNCVFFYIGLIPEVNFLKKLDIVKNSDGFIKVDASMRTNISGIFAAGDVIDKNLRQVVTALNDGAIAAIAIKDYLNNEYHK